MADFYAARDTTTAPLPWPSIAPPVTMKVDGATSGLAAAEPASTTAKAAPSNGGGSSANATANLQQTQEGFNKLHAKIRESMLQFTEATWEGKAAADKSKQLTG